VSPVRWQPRGFPTTPVLDACNRANEGPPPTGWATNHFGNYDAPGYVIDGNQMRGDTGGSFGGAYAAGYLLTPVLGGVIEMWFELPTWTSGVLDLSVFKKGTSGDGNLQGYYMKIGAGGLVRLGRYNNSTETALLSDASGITPGSGAGMGVRLLPRVIQGWYREPSTGLWRLALSHPRDQHHYDAWQLGIYCEATSTRIDNVGGGPVPRG